MTTRYAVAMALLCVSAACTEAQTRSAAQDQPWTAESTVQPADLVRELASTDKPMVVYIGPAFLYRQGHVPGATMHGPASTPQGLSELKSWAESLPRSANLVIYCGCCPIADCPNLRPGFEALQAMGFTRLRVLILPTNFGTDWVGKGHPVER
jgi:thiosulfate/3-mercaptopyruvate sulfurtransferase